MKRQGFTVVKALIVMNIIAIFIALVATWWWAINMAVNVSEANKEVTVAVEAAESEWSVVELPYNRLRTRMLHSVIEVNGKQYLVVTKDYKDCPITVVPIDNQVIMQAERE